jgi:hypothetical protein
VISYNNTLHTSHAFHQLQHQTFQASNEPMIQYTFARRTVDTLYCPDMWRNSKTWWCRFGCWCDAADTYNLAIIASICGCWGYPARLSSTSARLPEAWHVKRCCLIAKVWPVLEQCWPSYWGVSVHLMVPLYLTVTTEHIVRVPEPHVNCFISSRFVECI